MNTRRFVLYLVGIVSLLLVAMAIIGVPDTHADPVPFACYNPQNAYNPLCAGARFSWPPGYSIDNPGSWGPWAQYSPCYRVYGDCY
jgi:hypothetical protein